MRPSSERPWTSGIILPGDRSFIVISTINYYDQVPVHSNADIPYEGVFSLTQAIITLNYLLCILEHCYYMHHAYIHVLGTGLLLHMNEKIRNQQEDGEYFITRKCVNFAPFQTLLLWSKWGRDRWGRFQAKKIIVLGKYERTRLFGRPTHTLDDNIKMDPKVLEWWGAGFNSSGL